MDKEEAIKEHRKLWNWLYQHPSKRKEDYPKWERNGGNIPRMFNDCFLCEYARNLSLFCPEACPLEWPDGGCTAEPSKLFRRWGLARSPKTRKKYAKIIRDLPEKE